MNDAFIESYLTTALKSAKENESLRKVYETKNRYFRSLGFFTMPSIIADGYVRRFELFKLFDPDFEFEDALKTKSESELIEFRDKHRKRIESYVNKHPILQNTNYKFRFSSYSVIYAVFNIRDSHFKKLKKSVKISISAWKKIIKDFDESGQSQKRSPENVDELANTVFLSVIRSIIHKKYVIKNNRVIGDLFPLINTIDNISGNVYPFWCWLSPFIPDINHGDLFERNNDLKENIDEKKLFNEFIDLSYAVFHELDNHSTYQKLLGEFDLQFQMIRSKVMSFSLKRLKH